MGLLALACAPAALGVINPEAISILKVGNGSQAFTGNVAQNVSIVSFTLDNKTPLGTVPVTGVALSSKNDDADGHLNLSSDGKYLTLGGYAAAQGAAYPVTSGAARAVARVDMSGNVATASFATIYPNKTINAVAS